MRIVILPDEHQVAVFVADTIVRAIKANPDTVLGLATGSTPVAMYQQLVNLYESNLVSFSRVATFNLDEYVGIAADHPQSYRHFMNENLFSQIDIDLARTHVPKANSLSVHTLERAAADYEDRIKALGGVDIQVLGIGENGHIGFNEPTSSLSSRTRIKTLTQSTCDANRRFFKEDEFQPGLALTMGIGTILDSRQILLMATGERKAKAIAGMVEGAISAMNPASALQQHADTIVVIDQAAATELVLSDYYLWCEQQRAQLQTVVVEHTRVTQ